MKVKEISNYKFSLKFVFISIDGDEEKSHFGDGNADTVIMNVFKPKENIGYAKTCENRERRVVHV